jgi:hypothetical protein
MKRKMLVVVVMVLAIASGALIARWYSTRSSRSSAVKPPESNGRLSIPPADKGQADQLRSVEELRVLYPGLFNRLDASVYEGEPFDGRDALRDFHQSPFSQKNRDAYEAVVRAVAVQLRTIPDECLTQMAAYDGASQKAQGELDLGDIPPTSLESFLDVRSLLVEGLAKEEVPVYHKQAALKNVQLAPRIFAKPSLVRQLQVFANSGNQDAATSGGIVATIQGLPPLQPAKRTSGGTVCKLKP